MDKICTKCQQRLPISSFSRDKYKRGGYRSACKACSALEFKAYKEENPDAYKRRLKATNEGRAATKELDPVKIWAHDAYHNAKSRAKRGNIEFSITKDWLIANAPIRCPLLEVELTYNADRSTLSSASVDRIDPNKGYTPANCKVISCKANRMKSNANLDELIKLVNNMKHY